MSTPTTTITLTITIAAPAERVLDNLRELAGGLAELRACAARTAEAAASGPSTVTIVYTAADPRDPAAAALIERKLPHLGTF